MIRHFFIILILILNLSLGAKAQNSAMRINALGLATGTINAGVEFAVAPKWSVDASLLCNPIKTDRLRIQTIGGTVGVKRWRFEPHVGAFWGVHAVGATYDWGGKTNHYKGWLTGIGGSYGYSWLLSTRWNFTLEAGAALCYMQDRKQNYYTPPYDDRVILHYRRLVLLPSKLEISFSYLF